MKFDELKYLFMKEIEKFKKSQSAAAEKYYILQAYKNVMKVLNDVGDSIEVTPGFLETLPLTKHMKERLGLLTKKKLTAAQKKEQASFRLKNNLEKILGIGDKKIDELLKAGLKSIEQLEEKKWFALLNTDTQFMILYKPIRKIPRDIIAEIEPLVKSFKGAHIDFVGSYRRELPYSKDIDILVLTDDADILNKLLVFLKSKFKSVHAYANGPAKMAVILEHNGTKVKMDIFRAPPKEYYSHLLYSTGSKRNNLQMRAKAKKMGLLLNQTGLYKTGKRLNTAQDTEEFFYNKLGLPYLSPAQR